MLLAAYCWVGQGEGCGERDRVRLTKRILPSLMIVYCVFGSRHTPFHSPDSWDTEQNFSPFEKCNFYNYLNSTWITVRFCDLERTRWTIYGFLWFAAVCLDTAPFWSKGQQDRTEWFLVRGSSGACFFVFLVPGANLTDELEGSGWKQVRPHLHCSHRLCKRVY